ncbi:MAG: hypothetical protein OXH68_05700 [Gammaproteobacteria bacterium]|nr:hypothetical protein [Gammaproteobacteria bacterium]
MPRRDLSDTLRGLVSRHGLPAVLHCLADIEPLPDSQEACTETKTLDPPKAKPSAAACVSRMTLSPHKVGAVRRAAELFDDKRFLPALSDIREFSRVHGLDLPKTASRASSIHRVFAFIASMDSDVIEHTLDDGAFSGPTRLAPIADAIRGHSGTRPHDRPIVDHSLDDPASRQQEKPTVNS